MRLVVCLFAESRRLLPVNDPIYAQAYGVRSLYERLEEAVRMEGGVHTLFNHHTAWARLMALFRLIYGGSAHGAFPLRAYGGILFRPGKPDDPDPVSRALHLLEHAVPVGDATMHAVLRKLMRGPLPVLRGRQKTFVEGPVDYTDLRTEFIGLIYEGLLDYRVKRTDAEIGPQVFLNLGREPVLPLNRLEEMLANDRNGLKNLLTTLRKEAVTAKRGERGGGRGRGCGRAGGRPGGLRRGRRCRSRGRGPGRGVRPGRRLPRRRGVGEPVGRRSGRPGRAGGSPEGQGVGRRIPGPHRGRGEAADQAGGRHRRVLPRAGREHPQGDGDVLHPPPTRPCRPSTGPWSRSATTRPRTAR